jgi:hypothetical protein
VFFPMLGDSGRRAFKTWGLTLIGATVAKVIYAAFLSVVLLGMAILGRVGDATGFLLACAFAWAVFLKRTELIGWMSIGDAEGGRQVSPIAQFLAFSAARRVGKKAAGTVSGVGTRGRRAVRGRLSDGSEVTRETAGAKLDKGARGLADTRHREAQKTVAKYEGQYGTGGSSGSGPRKGKKGAHSRSSDTSQQSRQASQTGARGGPAPTDEEKQRYEKAKGLIARVKDNEEKTGSPWTGEDLQKFSAENRELLAKSNDPLDHAHRANMDRFEVEELRGEKREQAEKIIGDATTRDRKRDTVSSEAVGRVVGRGRRTAERFRQFKENSGPDRVAELRKLRKERREMAHRARRRNISRGS